MKFASTFYISVQEVPQSPDSNSFPSYYVVAFFQRIYQPEFLIFEFVESYTTIVGQNYQQAKNWI